MKTNIVAFVMSVGAGVALIVGLACAMGESRNETAKWRDSALTWKKEYERERQERVRVWVLLNDYRNTNGLATGPGRTGEE